MRAALALICTLAVAAFLWPRAGGELRAPPPRPGADEFQAPILLGGTEADASLPAPRRAEAPQEGAPADPFVPAPPAPDVAAPPKPSGPREPVRVRLVGPGGTPIQGAWVYLGTEPGGHNGRRQTDAYGYAEIDGVRRGAWFDVSVDTEKAQPHAAPGHAVFKQDERDVTIQLGAPRYIEGRVVSQEGDAVRAVVTGSHSDWHEAGVFAEPDGTFRLGPLLPGSYRLRIGGADGFVGLVRDVRAPAVDVRIVLPRVASLERRIEASDGWIDAARWFASGQTWPLTPAHGRAESLRIGGEVPMGRGTLYLRDSTGRYALYRNVTLDEVPDPIRLVEGAMLEGTLVADRPTEIAFRMHEVVIPGDVEFGIDTFEIAGVPTNARGKLRVSLDDRVLLERPAWAGSKVYELSVEVPDED